MNHPSLEGQRLNLPGHVKHARLIAWVAEIAALTEAPTCTGATVRSRSTTGCAANWSRAAPSSG